MNVSAIREILKVVNRPGVISLAGGIPSPDSFPMQAMDALASSVFDKYGSAALQYDLTEGFPPLRQALSGVLSKIGITVAADEVLIASGSQGVLDGIGKILIDPGDLVAVEAPTYLGAIQALSPYEPSYVEVATDEDGAIPESLEDVLAGSEVKLIYLVPTFQNPTGRTLTLERRHRIAEIITDHGVLLVEDDPYRSLRFRGCPLPPIKSLAPDHVVYVSTLSKVFAPGLRIGFTVAPQAIRDWLVIAKQGVDLHTSTLNQALAAEYIAGGYLEEQIPKIVDLYRPKQQRLLRALAEDMPPGFSWSQPEGGMFVWVQGPQAFDMDPVYARSVDNGAAFVPGKYFFASPDRGRSTMRLNFTTATDDQISQAVGVIGHAIESELDS
ncbi:MAG: PLP-dependent aminotransferase family protein [bacterium]|nr:PLP-dependent aminotransferase family protein [bacterium]